MLPHKQMLPLLLIIAHAALLASGKRIPVYEDANLIQNQISLEDLEREQEQREQQQQLRPVVELPEAQHETSTLPPPRLPIRYTWRSSKPVAATVRPDLTSNTSKDVYESAAAASNTNPYSSSSSSYPTGGGEIIYVPPAQLERLRQLRLQHQQLSEGYALPASALLLTPAFRTPQLANIVAQQQQHQQQQQRINNNIKPIVSHAGDVLSEPSISIANGIRYLTGNELPETPLTLTPPPPSPLTRAGPPFGYVALHRPTAALEYGTPYTHINALRARPTPNQSKQYTFAPIRQHGSIGQRFTATPTQPRIPLPYPPSFISITTRRPAIGHEARDYFGHESRDYFGHAAPFRPSQPDPTPTDLWANRDAKSLLDSYIPSWEVLRLIKQQQQEQQLQQQQQTHFVPVNNAGGSGAIFGYHTLAFANGAPYNARLYKRGLKQVQTAKATGSSNDERKIVKKSLDKQIAETSEESPLAME